MPLDHKPRTTTKPLTPALSSNLRTRPTHGFNPRLAATTPTSPASATQRTLRQHTLSPDRADEARSTLSLNSNVTPRSGARNTRFDTDSPSTPDTPARSNAMIVGDQLDAQAENCGLGMKSPATPTYSRSKPTDQLSLLPTASVRRISAGSSASSAKDESKFFRADDVKPSSAPSKNDCTRPKTIYNTRGPSPRVSPKKPTAAGAQRLDERSFYSRNAANQQGPRVPKPSLTQKLSYASNTAASTCSLPSKPQATTTTIRSSAAEQSNKAHSMASIALVRQRAYSNTQSAVNSTLDRRRSSSLNIKPAVVDTKAHRKSLSTSSSTISPVSTRSPIVIQVPENRLPQANADRTSHALDTATAISPSSSSPRSASLGSTNTAATSAASEIAKLDVQTPMKPQLHTRHTRGSSETTAIQPVTKEQLEAASNARRERKVLDLEISNSSLLAVNKTLEKELRKQNAELRRFRRLSRSGRLSFTPSNRIISGASTATLATLQEAENDDMPSPASPNSSDPGSLYDEDDFSDDRSSSFTESSDKMRRRARDEKGLMQDLQRHQQILVDSQKLTQLIQRCLNCTDELIKDGQKALAYQVQEKEVEVGGRVLNPDDDAALSEIDPTECREGMSKFESRQGLLTPSITRTELEEAAMWINGLQSLDGQNETVHGIERILLEKTTTESPLSTLHQSPVIWPER